MTRLRNWNHSIFYSSPTHPDPSLPPSSTLPQLKTLADLITKRNNNILCSIAPCYLIRPNHSNHCSPAVLLIPTLQTPTLGAHLDFCLGVNNLYYDIAICEIQTAQSSHLLLSHLCLSRRISKSLYRPRSHRRYLSGLHSIVTPIMT